MAEIIPLQAVPSQKVTVSLAGQLTQIEIYQKGDWVYCNLYVNNDLIVGGVICENLNRIKRSAYLAFTGDLCFYDNQGDTDPVYTGLGDRYELVYLTEEDLAA